MKIRTSFALIAFSLFILFSCKKKDEMKIGRYNAVMVIHRTSAPDTVEYFSTVGPVEDSDAISFRFNNGSDILVFLFNFSSSNLIIKKEYQTEQGNYYTLNSHSKTQSSFGALGTPEFTSDTTSIEFTFNFVE